MIHLNVIYLFIKIVSNEIKEINYGEGLIRRSVRILL